MIKHQMNLSYTLSPGWMEPFAAGLKSGKVVARRCDGCGHTSFPPLRSCECGSNAGSWVELVGHAQIVQRTDGQDGSFALVRFEGADTASVVRLVSIPQGQSIGQISKSTDNLPAMILGPAEGGAN